MPNDDFDIKLDRKKILAIAEDRGMEDAMAILAGVGETAAKARAPVDTGNLRRSITHDVGRDLRGYYGRYGTNVFYGIYQELGTRFHPAHPYLRPALEAIRRFLRG